MIEKLLRKIEALVARKGSFQCRESQQSAPEAAEPFGINLCEVLPEAAETL